MQDSAPEATWLCLPCATPRSAGAQGLCPQCSTALVAATAEHVEALVQQRLERQLGAWRASGLLTATAAERLAQTLRGLPEADTGGGAEAVERRVDEVAASVGRLVDWRPEWLLSAARSLEEAARAEREAQGRKGGEEGRSDVALASEAGQALFGQAGALGSGLQAVAELDEGRQGVPPRLQEYVWWFIGTVLVLGGSLMGVREAWRALGGVPRQLLVGGALFAYHASFVGLGVLLARRALPVGRVLAGIGLGLLPVVFVALSALAALAPWVAVPVALGVAGLSLLTLRPAGRLLYGIPVGTLGTALLPSLLASLPLLSLEGSPWWRSLCALAGVAAFVASVGRAQATHRERPVPLVAAAASLYGALALALFAMTSGASGFDSLAPGEPAFAGMVLWALLLAVAVAAVASQGAAREAWPHAAPVVEVLCHALLVGCSLGAAASAFAQPPGVQPAVDGASAAVPALAAGAWLWLQPRRRALVHPAVLAATLASLLVARLLQPEQVEWWLVGPALLASVLLGVARLLPLSAQRTWLLMWGSVLGLLSVLATSWVVQARGGTPWPQVAAGVAVALAAHGVAGWQWRPLHYLGGVAALHAALAVATVYWPAHWEERWPALAAFTVAGALYGLAGLWQSAWQRRVGEEDRTLLPLEDLSLGAAVLALASAATPSAGGEPVLRAVLLASVSTLLLLLRAPRDCSRLDSLLAALGLTLALTPFASLLAGVQGDVASALLASLLATAFAAVAALRDRQEPLAEPPQGRRVLGMVRLPFAAAGRALWTDGFATMALVQGVFGMLLVAGWLPRPDDSERSLVLLAGGLLSGVAVLAFLSRGFVALRLRGSVAALAAAGALVALTALVNRAGRPRPPDATALRLVATGIGLWVLAQVARRFGPRLARWLENEPQGKYYHAVFHTGVAALVAVMVWSALRVGPPWPSRTLGVVPPLLLLGSALLLWLLGRSFRSAVVANLGLALSLPGAALWAAQGVLTGRGLVALDPPGGRWVPAGLEGVAREAGWLEPAAWLPPGETVEGLWLRALAGVAAAGLVHAGTAWVLGLGGERLARLRALLAPESAEYHEGLVRALRRWAKVAVGLVVLAALFQPGLLSAGLVLATGVVLHAGGGRGPGRVVAGLGVLLLVHAGAHQTRVAGTWPGPVLAAIALALVVLGPRVARWRGVEERLVLPRLHQAAGVYGIAAVVYALAAGGQTSTVLAVPRLVLEVLYGLSGRWMTLWAVPWTGVLLGAVLLVGAWQWRGTLAALNGWLGVVVTGGSGLAGLAVGLLAGSGWPGRWPDYELLVSVHGLSMGLGAAVVAAGAHAAGRWVRQGDRLGTADGLGAGRDTWLLGAAGLLGLSALSMETLGEWVLPQALGAIALAVGVCLHAAWREHTGRHVYYVQVAVVGVYALVRLLFARELRPEHDALFALALGFVLLGVTVMARRAGVPPVAAATRRFAALLPLGVWLVLPGDATGEAALLAGGSGLLYASLGAVEHSRLFGSLAAAACNLALLVAALAWGLEGLEIYLAPLGLLLTLLGQLFSGSLPRAARNAVRILGGLLLYVPAAAKVTLQLGQASEGLYSVVFGVACLVGVAAGVLFEIRAWLALGTLFLTLDVVANLVHAGLRDHRVGFLVMTLAGLAIVGGRVLATLQRAEWERLVRRVRTELRGWD